MAGDRAPEREDRPGASGPRHLTLPPECAAFLAAGGQFTEVHNDCGPVVLRREPVRMIIPVQPQGTIDVDLADLDDDDEYPEPPTHEVVALDLVAQATHGHPTGLLIWLPVEGCFGSWDCDHWRVRAFPGVSWAEVCRDPGSYLEGGLPDPPGTSYLDPTVHHPLRTTDLLGPVYADDDGQGERP